MTPSQITLAALISAAVCAVFAIVFIYIRVTKAPIYGLLAKTVASLSFVAMGAVALYLGMRFNFNYTLPKLGAPMFLFGLSAGMIGDIMLDLKRTHKEFEVLYTFTGMGAFSLGHIAYIAGLCLIAAPIISGLWFPAVISAVIALVLTPIIMLISTKLLHARFGKFLVFSTFYAALLIFVTAFSIWLTIIKPEFMLVAIGFILFLISDLLLSQIYFVEGKAENKYLVATNLTVYYAAQIFIAAFLFALI